MSGDPIDNLIEELLAKARQDPSKDNYEEAIAACLRFGQTERAKEICREGSVLFPDFLQRITQLQGQAVDLHIQNSQVRSHNERRNQLDGAYVVMSRDKAVCPCCRRLVRPLAFHCPNCGVTKPPFNCEENHKPSPNLEPFDPDRVCFKLKLMRDGRFIVRNNRSRREFGVEYAVPEEIVVGSGEVFSGEFQARMFFDRLFFRLARFFDHFQPVAEELRSCPESGFFEEESSRIQSFQHSTYSITLRSGCRLVCEFKNERFWKWSMLPDDTLTVVRKADVPPDIREFLNSSMEV